MFTVKQVEELNIHQGLKDYLLAAARFSESVDNAVTRSVIKNSTIPVMKLFQRDRPEWSKLLYDRPVSGGTNGKTHDTSRYKEVDLRKQAAERIAKEGPGDFILDDCLGCPDKGHMEESASAQTATAEPVTKKKTRRKRKSQPKQEDMFEKMLNECTSAEDVLNYFNYQSKPTAEVKAQIHSILLSGYDMKEKLAEKDEWELAELAQLLFEQIQLHNK